MQVLAVDVSKNELVVFDGVQSRSVANARASIERLLRVCPDSIVVAEPTSSYHFELIYAAHELGHRVHLVNPKEMRNYKDSRSFRAKTDVLDAQYIHEFAIRHLDDLRPWVPPPAEVRAVRELLGRRHAASKALMQLRQTCPEVRGFQAVEDALVEMIQGLDQDLARFADLDDNYRRMKTIPGVGPLGAAALSYVFAAHSFQSSDALVAFLGLDLRVNDSGLHRGRRRLSKRGDPLLRRLITCAGWSLLRTNLAKDKALSLKAQKRHHPERMVIAARKILRTAYALNATQTSFDRDKWRWET